MRKFILLFIILSPSFALAKKPLTAPEAYGYYLSALTFIDFCGSKGIDTKNLNQYRKQLNNDYYPEIQAMRAEFSRFHLVTPDIMDESIKNANLNEVKEMPQGQSNPNELCKTVENRIKAIWE